MGLVLRHAILVLVFSVTTVLVSGCPPALTVEAGLDLYETALDNSKGAPQVMIEVSIIELAENSLPLNFFGTGSDPLEGTFELQGNPLGSSPHCDSNIGNTDTIVERKQDAELPGTNSSATVPIEMLELSLACKDAVVVTYNSGTSTEQWDLFVTLTPMMQSTGSMTIRRTGRDGGTFDSTLDVYPRLTFVRHSDSEMRILDIQDTLVTERAPWLTNVPNGELPSRCQSNFVPSLGRLPVLGRLFSEKVEMRGQQLLIFVTPRIVRDDE